MLVKQKVMTKGGDISNEVLNEMKLRGYLYR